MAEDYQEVIVCAGPPTCMHEDEEAIEMAMAGCPNCTHIVIKPDGDEEEYRIKAH